MESQDSGRARHKHILRGVPKIGRRYIENQNMKLEMVWGGVCGGLFYLTIWATLSSKKSSNSWKELAVPLIRLMVWHFITVRLNKKKGKWHVHFTPGYVYVKNPIQWRLCDAVPFNCSSKLGQRETADKLVCVSVVFIWCYWLKVTGEFVSSSGTWINKLGYVYKNNLDNIIRIAYKKRHNSNSCP